MLFITYMFIPQIKKFIRQVISFCISCLFFGLNFKLTIHVHLYPPVDYVGAFPNVFAKNSVGISFNHSVRTRSSQNIQFNLPARTFQSVLLTGNKLKHICLFYLQLLFVTCRSLFTPVNIQLFTVTASYFKKCMKSLAKQHEFSLVWVNITAVFY